MKRPIFPVHLTWVLLEIAQKTIEARMNMRTNDVVIFVIIQPGVRTGRVFGCTRSDAIEMLIAHCPNMKETRLALYEKPAIDEVPVIVNEGDVFYSIWWKVPGAVLS